MLETLLISFYNISLELSKFYSKNKNISFLFSSPDSNKSNTNNQKTIEPYFDNQLFIFVLKTIFYLNEEKLNIFIESSINKNNIDIQKEVLSEFYSSNEQHLISFNNSESRINTLKTISLKIIFKSLTLLGNKNIEMKKFTNFNAFIKKISLDYIKILGDIFTFNVDFRSNIFQEKKNETPFEKKLIVYLSNILEMFRLLYKYPEITIQEMIENRVE